MVNKVVLISMILIVLLALPSCIITSSLINVEIKCDEFAENPHSIRNDFQVEIGDKITVKLCSNPSTGFEWDYEMTKENVLKEEDHDFEEPERDVPGSAGIEVWTFESVEKGTTTVHMEYSQPWEGGLKAEWIYTINVTVK
jgi:predicted secreted protein